LNQYQGETPITLGGKTYTLRLTTNRMAHLERLLDCRGMLNTRLLGAGADTVRAALHVCLTVPDRKGPPLIRPPFTLDDMGEMIDEAGGLQAVAEPYWELLVNCGIADRTMAENAGLIKKSPGPKAVAASPPAEVEEPVAIGSI